jgi:hypothetical protein
VGFSYNLTTMGEAKTERSNCRFTVQTNSGKPVIVLQLYQRTISLLRNTVVGFDLLGGTRAEEAKKLAEMLNERVLDVYVTADVARAEG